MNCLSNRQKFWTKNQFTRQERLKSALYLRLKKRKTFFWGKNEFFSFGKCRIMPIDVKGNPLGFINIHSVAKYEKKIEGGPFSHSAEKIQGGTL